MTTTHHRRSSFDHEQRSQFRQRFWANAFHAQEFVDIFEQTVALAIRNDAFRQRLADVRQLHQLDPRRGVEVYPRIELPCFKTVNFDWAESAFAHLLPAPRSPNHCRNNQGDDDDLVARRDPELKTDSVRSAGAERCGIRWRGGLVCQFRLIR